MAVRWGTRHFAEGAAVAARLEVAGCAAADEVAVLGYAGAGPHGVLFLPAD